MKKLLIVVDYQNDFVTGSLGSPAAEAIAEKICEKIQAYRAQGDEVRFTYDTHTAAYSDTQEGRKLPVPHCLDGSSGWMLDPRVEALRESQDRCYKKGAFGSQQLFDDLRGSDFTQVELAGVVTNICVISNAVLVKTALPEAEIIVDAAATASNDPSLHKKALEVLEGMQVTVL